MVEIIENLLIMAADFLNSIYLFEIEFNPGEYTQVGRIITGFVFIVVSLYLSLDATGILDEGE